MEALVIDRVILPEPIFSCLHTEKIRVFEQNGDIVLSPVKSKPAANAGGSNRELASSNYTAPKSVQKMSLNDILKLRGKYAGDISVERFLEQKRIDIELEEKV